MKPTILEPYWWAVDKTTNASLYIEWLDAQISYDSIISWICVVLVAWFAWWMAKYIAKNL